MKSLTVRLITVLFTLLTPLAALAYVPISTERVSIGSKSIQANGDSGSPAIDSDGSHVAFVSKATNLSPVPIPSGTGQAYLRDMNSGDLKLVSYDHEGNLLPTGVREVDLSDDGQFVVFSSNYYAGPPSSIPSQLYIRDTSTDTTVRITNYTDFNGFVDDGIAISNDGRYVSFAGYKSDLVAELQIDQMYVFRWDRVTGITEVVSRSFFGEPVYGRGRTDISANGRYVLYESPRSNIVFGDTNDGNDVFVRDMEKGINIRASLANDGSQFKTYIMPSRISGNGRYVAMMIIDDGKDPFYPDSLSEISLDYYVRDLQLNTTRRASISSEGYVANDDNNGIPSISYEGTIGVFASKASNFDYPDGNSSYDVFVRDIGNGHTDMVSRSLGGVNPGNDDSFEAVISDDGTHVAFTSRSSNLVSGDTNHKKDVFISELGEGTHVPIYKFRWPLEFNPWVNPYFEELMEKVLLDHDHNPRTEAVKVLGYEITHWRNNVMAVGSCIVPMPGDEEQFSDMLLTGKYISVEGGESDLPEGCINESVLGQIQKVLR